MKKLNLAWYLCLGYCILGLALPFGISLLAVRNRLDSNQPEQRIYLNLAENGAISQTFTANHDYLNIIMLNLKNPGLAAKGDYLFSLTTRDGQTILERPFSGYNVGDPSDVRFQFDPVAASGNQKFIMTVKPVKAETPGLSVGADANKQLTYSVYFRNMNKKTAILDWFLRLVTIVKSDRVFFLFWFGVLVLLGWIGFVWSKKTK